MDISRKTDYALRMLAMLAEEPERLLSVRTAAEEVNVPYSFARSIQHGLVQAGIVESLRGVHGGMRLKVSPDDVTIRQVVEAVQGPMVMNDCTAPDGDCARMGTCCYHPLWAGAPALMRDSLGQNTMASMIFRMLSTCRSQAVRAKCCCVFWRCMTYMYRPVPPAPRAKPAMCSRQ